jgi:hypothetical protein
MWYGECVAILEVKDKREKTRKGVLGVPGNKGRKTLKGSPQSDSKEKHWSRGKNI